MSEDNGHFYLADGTPVHQVMGKNGKMRNFSMRWDRHLNALPSVTTYQSCLRSSYLENWLKRKVAEACYSNPALATEDVRQYTDRVLKEADKERDEAATEGTSIHNALEDFFHGRPYDPCIQVYVDAANNKMAEHGLVRTGSEIRVINLQEGYAGTTDAPGHNGKGVGIIDFKGCKTKDGKLRYENDKYAMQVAAYWAGHYKHIPEPGSHAWGCNLMISRNEPGVAHALLYDTDTLIKAYEAFLNVCAIWRHLNDYDPRRSA
jgi:hypothetical protein